MNVVVIFAGGVGSRMKSDIPKQFIEVNEKPIIIHTIELFEYNDEIDEIYLVITNGYVDYMMDLLEDYQITKVKGITTSGSSALDSIYKGLEAVEKRHKNDNPIVLIHDGVRPFVSKDVIGNNILCVKKYGNAITSIPAFETTIVSSDGHSVDNVLTRKETYIGQAPQSFYLNDIIEAHRKIRQTENGYNDIVDCCNIMNKLGKTTYLVEGNRGNIKITTEEDLYTLKGFLRYKRR